jgi:hypothetical protein
LAFETITGNSGKYIGDRARALQRSAEEKSSGELLQGVTEWDTKFRCVTSPPAR